MPKPSGTQSQHQLQFGWSDKAKGSCGAVPCPTPRQQRSQTSGQLAVGGIGGVARKPRLRDVLEKMLRQRSIPYVDVAESRRALSGGSWAAMRLRMFHFVVYQHPVPNWLVYAATPDKQVHSDLRQWEKIFGSDFVAVLARQMKDGSIRFRTLDGQTLNLS